MGKPETIQKIDDQNYAATIFDGANVLTMMGLYFWKIGDWWDLERGRIDKKQMLYSQPFYDAIGGRWIAFIYYQQGQYITGVHRIFSRNDEQLIAVDCETEVTISLMKELEHGGSFHRIQVLNKTIKYPAIPDGGDDSAVIREQFDTGESIDESKLYLMVTIEDAH